ncbi:hypothetical protein LSH36_1512g00006 [Paralvinella palmiformis]|uniref:Uncharacterized protein n=1 Tax=Paralvinella palmiformis TaxID=53620 RepID=A0AAD9ITJ8_9ANNE|nr:hypothetical protein LSH36_1512g00006 [Paralvinella palmiformis]
MNRKLRSPLDLLSPSVEDKIQEKQYEQKRYHHLHAHERRLCIGDQVMVLDLGMGLILEQSGPLSFKIRLCDGRVFRRHQDHLRLCNISDDHTRSRNNVTIPIATDVPSVRLPNPTTPVQLEREKGNRSDIEPTSYAFHYDTLCLQIV